MYLFACSTQQSSKKLKELTTRYTDNYKTGGIIGTGSTCVVRKCTRITDNKQFAVKIINKKSLGKYSIKFIKREIYVLKKLKNTEGVIYLEDIYENDKFIHIILELCTGNDLLSYVINKNCTKKPISEQHVAYMFYQICFAVHKCHKKRIIHRDLKPENIILKNSQNLKLKLSDFGLSYYFDKNHQGVRKMSTKCGSPIFCAPEVMSNKYYTGNCDWWSCGAILYVLLSGTYPFYHSNVSEVCKKVVKGVYTLSGAPWKNISDDAKDLISKLLVKDVKKRYGYFQIMKHPFMTKNLIF